MQPGIRLLSDDMVQRVLDEAFQLMMEPGVKVQSQPAGDSRGSRG
jgi:trimethylamine:corrinoid methyltransferase-like protein